MNRKPTTAKRGVKKAIQFKAPLGVVTLAKAIELFAVIQGDELTIKRASNSTLWNWLKIETAIHYRVFTLKEFNKATGSESKSSVSKAKKINLAIEKDGEFKTKIQRKGLNPETTFVSLNDAYDAAKVIVGTTKTSRAKKVKTPAQLRKDLFASPAFKALSVTDRKAVKALLNK